MWRRSSWSVLLALLCSASCGGGGNNTQQQEAPCGVYPAQSTSPYVLPYPVGSAFVVGQGNCSPGGSHARGTLVQFAYDFLMPSGSSVVASREGEVILLEESFQDSDHTSGHENFVNVRHSDGTIAAYVHLTQNGALVGVGDMVQKGEAIGLSGNTGDSSAPHLHFHVQSCAGCSTRPVVFLNTRAHPTGLVVNESYLAEPY